VSAGPYELALLLADRLGERGIPAGCSCSRRSPVAAGAGRGGCATFDGRLAAEGITFRPKTTATAVEPGAVVAADTRIPFDLLLGVPPHRVPGVVSAAGLAEPGAWVKVNPATLETRFRVCTRSAT
jgi:sulfide:quinone oxidoreductase